MSHLWHQGTCIYLKTLNIYSKKIILSDWMSLLSDYLCVFFYFPFFHVGRFSHFFHIRVFNAVHQLNMFFQHQPLGKSTSGVRAVPADTHTDTHIQVSCLTSAFCRLAEWFCIWDTPENQVPQSGTENSQLSQIWDCRLYTLHSQEPDTCLQAGQVIDWACPGHLKEWATGFSTVKERCSTNNGFCIPFVNKWNQNLRAGINLPNAFVLDTIVPTQAVGRAEGFVTLPTRMFLHLL